jgi:hypothetical protein
MLRLVQNTVFKAQPRTVTKTQSFVTHYFCIERISVNYLEELTNALAELTLGKGEFSLRSWGSAINAVVYESDELLEANDLFVYELEVAISELIECFKEEQLGSLWLSV